MFHSRPLISINDVNPSENIYPRTMQLSVMKKSGASSVRMRFFRNETAPTTMANI